MTTMFIGRHNSLRHDHKCRHATTAPCRALTHTRHGVLAALAAPILDTCSSTLQPLSRLCFSLDMSCTTLKHLENSISISNDFNNLAKNSLMPTQTAYLLV